VIYRLYFVVQMVVVSVAHDTPLHVGIVLYGAFPGRERRLVPTTAAMKASSTRLHDADPVTRPSNGTRTS
jgi:hypothetical protein